MGHLDKIAACLFAIIFISPAAPAAEGDSKKSSELAWARSVAEDFLNAALAGQGEQAQQLLDSSLKEAFAKEGEHRLREWLNNSIAIHGYQQPEIRSEAIAPDQDEAVFKGTFRKQQQPLQFTLRVVKDKASDKWRVTYFQFREQETAK